MASSLPSPSQTGLLQALFDDFPLGIIVADGQGRILRSNPNAEALLGLPDEVQRGRGVAGPEWDVVRLDGSPMPAEEYASVRAIKEGRPVRDVEMGVARPDGTRCWLNVCAAPVEGGCVAITFEDIGPRVRGTAVMLAHARLVEGADALGLEALLRATLDELEDLTGSCIGFFHFVLEDQETLHLQAWSTRTEAEFCRAEGKGAHYPVGQAGIWADAVREKRPVIHNDYAHTEGRRGLPEGHAEIRRELVVPVLRSGRVRAVLGVGNKPTPYDDGDVASVQRLADLVWELAALKQAKLAAEHRAEQIETVSASAPGLIHAFRLGPEGSLTMPFLSAAAGDLYGLDPGAIAADFGRVLARTPGPDRDRLVAAGLESARDLSPYHLRWRYDHPAKGLRWLENWSLPRREPDGGTLWHGITMDMTALVEAEQAARQSEASLESAFAHSPHGMALVSTSGDYLKVNHAFCEMLGRSAGEIRALGIRGVTHPDDLPRDQMLSTDLLEERTASGQVEKRYLHRDGREVWAQVSVALLRDDDGLPLHFIVQMLDITERRRAQERLEESERRYRMLAENASDVIWTMDLDGRITYVSPSIRKLRGYTAEEVMAQRLDEILCPGSAQAAIQLLEAVLKDLAEGEDPVPFRGELEQTCRDGGSVWTEVTATALRDASGRATGVLGVTRDIRERRATEAILRASESRFRQISAASGEWIWEVDPSGLYTYSSEGVERILGYRPTELVGRLRFHDLWPEADRAALLPKVMEAFHRREILHDLPNAALHRDGHLVRLETSGLPILGAQGELLGYRGVDRDVSEREATQEALRASEDRFAKAFLDNPVAMAIVRAADNRIQEVNESWVSMTGIARQVAIGMSLGDTGLIPDPAVQGAMIEALQRTGSLHNHPLRVHRSDGRILHLLMSARVAVLGGETCLLTSAQDVSEKVRAEEALRENEFHLEEAQKLAQVGHWTVDHLTGATHWSAELFRIHGLDPAKAPPSWPEFQRSFHPQDLASMQANYEGHLRAGLPSARFAYRIILGDGSVRHIRSECRSVYDPDGRPLRTFGTDQDITDLVRAEKALRESERRFRGLWEQAPVAVCEEDYSAIKARFDAWRREGLEDLGAHLDRHPDALRELAALVRVVEVNDATVRLFGAPSAEALVRDLPSHFGPDSLAVFKAELAELYAGQRSTEHENSAVDLQGRKLDLQVRLTVVPGHEEDLARVLVSFTDLTERKAAEAGRQRLERELNHLQRLESLGRLAGGVSHDMNNVLGAIMAVGSLLKVRHRDDPAIVKDAEALLQASIRGRDLVKGLRDFSRKELESATDLDLNELARREADLLERTTLKRVAVDLDLAPGLAKVFGEGSTISNALMNLCLNACDAMPAGGTITLSTRNLGEGFVELAVQDTGEGMAPEVLVRATEPFFTTKPAGKGTGLGLSQVYGTMKAHGGTLDIQSRLGRGTRIALAFPVSTTSRPEGEAAEDRPSEPRRALRILLVDDEELIRRTFMLLLESLGHQVQTATGGLDALRRLEAGMEADLTVLDVNMPGMDGLETLSRLRILRPDLPVVLSTGFADDRIPAILGRFPKVRILKEPFGISDLEKLLAAWP